MLSAQNKEGRRFHPRFRLRESRGTISGPRTFFTLRGCCSRGAASKVVPVAAIRDPYVLAARRLVKVNIYEGANHRHRSSRLVSRLLRRRGFVFIRRTGILSLLSALKKTRPPSRCTSADPTAGCRWLNATRYVHGLRPCQRSHPFISILYIRTRCQPSIVLSENTRVIVAPIHVALRLNFSPARSNKNEKWQEIIEFGWIQKLLLPSWLYSWKICCSEIAHFFLFKRNDLRWVII